MPQTLLSTLIKHHAEKYGARVALRYRDYDANKWFDISWQLFAHTVQRVSFALLQHGIGVQENIAVFAQNMPECLFVDFGAFAIRTVTIPFYATSSAAQVQYMVNDAHIHYVFVGEQYQYDIAFRVMRLHTPLRQIIIFDPKVVKDPSDSQSVYFTEFLQSAEAHIPPRAQYEARLETATTDDIANILYTSGTTGNSKGVTITHKAYEVAFEAHSRRFPQLGDEEIVLNFLPFTHVFERAWSYWCLTLGATLCINLKPTDVQRTMKEIHPTAMCSVPRFWEKVYQGVQEKILQSDPITRTIMHDGIKVGKKHNIDYLCHGKKPPLWLHLRYKLYDRTLYSLLKKTIGIERGKFFPTAGAAIPPTVQEFILSMGINMVAGYGLTESTASVSCEEVGKHVIGSVGKIMPHVQVRIGEQNEIQLKGESITKGYYKNPSATQDAFTDDGWFKTGDAGYVKEGNLFLTERIKDLFKTSNGKYIAPQAIESQMVVDRYIDQIAIIADQHKFVSALIIPDYKLIKEYADEQQIKYTDIADLLRKPEIIRLIKNRIDTLQQTFAHYEQIKKFTLLPQPFSIERGEMTNTLKIKRNVLYQNYAEEIKAMYEE